MGGKLLAAGSQGLQACPESSEWGEVWGQERELNALVYEVYGLTEQEIKIVEHN